MSNEAQQPETISRREAILRVSALLGGTALVGQAAMLAGCAKEPEPQAADDVGYSNELFSATDVAYLDEIAETILPETGTPGAKAAGVGPFIALMVLDSYYPADQQVFRSGLDTLNAESESENGKSFMDASSEERLALLRRLDEEQQQYTWNRKDGEPAHYFRMLKELTMLGYFTSEIGYTQAMRYAETPGRYDPCVPCQKGETAWADHV